MVVHAQIGASRCRRLMALSSLPASVLDAISMTVRHSISVRGAALVCLHLSVLNEIETAVSRPYIDRGKPGIRFQRGTVITVRDPPQVIVRRLALEMIHRHNSLDPELQPTLRVLLRWSENEGSGIPNPDAEGRETHYDPLPPEVQTKVTAIVDQSHWGAFVRKLVMTTLTKGSLAEHMGLSRAQFYAERRSALWYMTGRFESERIYG